MSEKKFLYHGSVSADITELKAYSMLHGTDKKVVYLTDNIPYALFYIWDENHNNYSRKFVTGWIKNSIACYEEMFPNQLETFYKGISGYLYCIEKSTDISAVDNREAMYYSEEDILIDRAVHISDIYQELLKYEKLGEFKLLRFNEQSEEKKNELIDKSAGIILKSDFFKNDQEKLKFYKKYFSAAWERAASYN
ncbi:MAG: hypothetical protein K2J76_08305 [Oscillospiraceae bacterium]|nr:hypothetical protein [Oscillospiraceae bacterium]